MGAGWSVSFGLFGDLLRCVRFFLFASDRPIMDASIALRWGWLEREFRSGCDSWCVLLWLCLLCVLPLSFLRYNTSLAGGRFQMGCMFWLRTALTIARTQLCAGSDACVCADISARENSTREARCEKLLCLENVLRPRRLLLPLPVLLLLRPLHDYDDYYYD